MINTRIIRTLLVLTLLILTTTGCSTISSIRPASAFRSALNITLKSDGDIGTPKFEKTLDTFTNSKVTEGNTLQILENGEHFFPKLFEEIKNANEYINIAMYDFTVDEIGKEVLDKLEDAMERGVKVKITYDHFGCVTDIDDFKEFTENGGEVRTFNPLKSWTFLRMNSRNHRKIIVIDGEKAFLSGLNISNNYDGDGFEGWRDSGVLIQGPACNDIEKVFAQSWNQAGSNWLGMNLPIVGSNPFKRVIDYPFIKVFGNLYKPKLLDIPPVGDVDIRIVEQSPEYIDSYLINLYTIVINAAKESVYISTPYFLPTKLIQRALLNAAKRGVDVRILTQEKSDLQLFKELAQGELHVYAKHGIRIWGWDKSVLHNKLAIIDGKYFIGGSVNLDARSLLMNYEIAYCTENKEAIKKYSADYLSDLELAHEYSYEETLKMITGKNILYAPIRGQM